MRIKILFLLSFTLIFSACNGQQTKKTEAGNTKERTFQMVSVPSVITETGRTCRLFGKTLLG